MNETQTKDSIISMQRSSQLSHQGFSVVKPNQDIPPPS